MTFTANSPLPSYIDSQTMQISWLYALGGTIFGGGEQTANHLYVTGAATQAAFETVLNLGCSASHGVNPATNQSDIITKVFALFKTLDVSTVEGVHLTYYANYAAGATTTASLLQTGDGQCGSWTSLFMDTLTDDGVTGLQYVLFQPTNYDGFLVNNWTFIGAGPYLNVYSAVNGIYDANGTGYAWLGTPNVTQGLGVAGQGNLFPASLFGNHQMLKITTAGGSVTYYDPSYGATYISPSDFGNRAISGYFNENKDPNNANQVDVTVIKNPGGNQINAVPLNFTPNSPR